MQFYTLRCSYFQHITRANCSSPDPNLPFSPSPQLLSISAFLSPSSSLKDRDFLVFYDQRTWNPDILYWTRQKIHEMKGKRKTSLLLLEW